MNLLIPPPLPLTYLCQTLQCCEHSGPGLISLFPFAASHKGVLVWDPQVLPQYKHLITEACASQRRKGMRSDLTMKVYF